MTLRGLLARFGRKGTLEFWIALMAGASLFATIAVVFYALNHLAGEVDRTDRALTQQTAQAAIKSFLTKLHDGHQDYARWDDAVTSLYGTPDPDFVRSSYADSTATGIIFDTAFLIDENGRDLFALRDGRSITISSKDYLGPALEHILERSDGPRGQYAFASGYFRTPDGIAAVVAGPVVPFSYGMDVPPGQKRMLVIAKHLTAAAIRRLGDEFVISGFSLAGNDSPAEQSLVLSDPSNVPIGRLVWSVRTGGSDVLATISPAVSTMLALLSVILMGVVFVAWANLRATMQSQKEAEHAASHDFLTGLPNRASLLATPLGDGAALRMQNDVCVVFLDLDGFKNVNDTHGHFIGDRALLGCAAGFSHISAGKGLLARVGGDEFAFLTRGSEAQRVASKVAEQFIEFLKEPIKTLTGDLRLGTSVGIASGCSLDTTIHELLRRSDIAMYEAKKLGGNRVAYYDANIDAKMQERATLTHHLREALAKGEITLAYQLIVDAATHEPKGVEALARWTMFNGRVIGPDIFISLAEEGGLIDKLGSYVLRRACLDALAWPSHYLSVNVSPVQFRDPYFEEIVGRVLAETGFPAHRLELEITERHLMAEPDIALAAMRRLKERGVTIALDDFGTGYSSIGYLRSFPFDRLKLDRSICADITSNANVQQLVQGTIAIARSMGLKVTAEGIEDEFQAKFLRLAGCELLQGFHFNRPMPASEIAPRLSGKSDDAEALFDRITFVGDERMSEESVT
ncbi:bifunctional diguanylate cyclase/phosphodiesterase [Taklimakanibacter deserti]|uniref:bifunctional diguanylate cyclase/phosphodiesterase n=1 Tax=Taklimakanibacter deserti TaxID=2267839 RepID=UPI000E646371